MRFKSFIEAKRFSDDLNPDINVIMALGDQWMEKPTDLRSIQLYFTAIIENVSKVFDIYIKKMTKTGEQAEIVRFLRQMQRDKMMFPSSLKFMRLRTFQPNKIANSVQFFGRDVSNLIKAMQSRGHAHRHYLLDNIEYYNNIISFLMRVYEDLNRVWNDVKSNFQVA